MHLPSCRKVSDNVSKYSYFSIMWYNLSLSLTKFAIVFLCLRVFAPSDWYKACVAVLAFITLYTLYIIIISITPCLPIHAYWDSTVQGWCFPNAVLWFVNAGLNIFTDILVVLLPIPGIFKLQLPRKQRIGVSLVFALGFLYVTLLICSLLLFPFERTVKSGRSLFVFYALNV